MAKADILNLMYSKNKSPLDFKFEQITAPPLLSFITTEDIAQLHKIATSLKYSGKMKKKYEMIDNIMRPRGFVKFHCGTNRIVYRHLEDQSFVVKIALDKVGLSDSPREYENQFHLKPFICKVFEVSPCGTVGSFERLEPITSREEFISVADDIFQLLTEKILGEYIMEDIGSKYFMNYAVRKGFGICLIDMPYLYKLDGNKLHCTNTLPNGYVCDGLIDYDDGFNNLICERCGKLYLATELKDEKKCNIKISKERIDLAMKVIIKRGNEILRASEKSTDTIIRTIENNEVAPTIEDTFNPVIRKYPRKDNRDFKKNNKRYDNNKDTASDLDIMRNKVNANVKLTGNSEDDNNGSLTTPIETLTKAPKMFEEVEGEVKEIPKPSKKVKIYRDSEDMLQTNIGELAGDIYEKLGMENPNASVEDTKQEENEPVTTPESEEITNEEINESEELDISEDEVTTTINNPNTDLLAKYGLSEEDFEEEPVEKIGSSNTNLKDLY